ncbi:MULTISPECIES: hypothetical protein [unclassified Curtobacterium]|jgi:uncharacterized membrane protein|uniref:hypothetical protein n=1 Tax=unclassified Curtobacterium TaxID=257496 RepID=UPI000FA2DCA3|nr:MULTISPECIES: hypothetical protein [unclassified Curtobacterium]ROQ04930.1 hypothetical protein EDF41_3048 [Curtobacterium sp. PhB171]ROQ22130.1 hypothetical protein EDF40_3215 [Curtobacterium sp. PhB170]ROS33490.1 hypothetical protein EDF25_2871 [Curtobacterium sp. PhB131]ROS64810.1 hypothetical protein EDF30_3223 [Curtobacterium sp. PhB141]
MPKQTVVQKAARILQRSEPERWTYTAALREVQVRNEAEPGYAWRLHRLDLDARARARAREPQALDE